MLVVISIISLALTIALPSVIGLFTAGADTQARNVIGSMMGAARGVAIENQSYALVHVQMGTDGKCWAAVMKGGYEDHDSNPMTPDSIVFRPVDGFPPRQMPGDMAFGEITSGYVTSSTYGPTVNTDLTGFTTFNVIFGPDGSLATLVNGAAPVIDTNALCFCGVGKQQIWDPPPPGGTGPALNEAGIRAMTAFHYKTLVSVSSRSGWLNTNGQFLCINQYTGKLLATKQ